MNHPASQILLVWLRSQSLLVEPSSVDPHNQNWPGFRSLMPEDPDEAVALYDYGAIKDGRLIAGGEVILHPSVNFRIRATQYNTGWDKAEALALALDGIVNDATVLVETTNYTIQAVSRLGGTLHNGLEEAAGRGNRRRHIFTFNVQSTIKQES